MYLLQAFTEPFSRSSRLLGQNLIKADYYVNLMKLDDKLVFPQLKVRKSQNEFFKPMFPRKNEQMNSTLLL